MTGGANHDAAGRGEIGIDYREQGTDPYSPRAAATAR